MATAVQVDREQSNAVNLAVLKRQDSKIQEIVDTATHVVIYEFDEETQSWVRTNGQRLPPGWAAWMLIALAVAWSRSARTWKDVSLWLTGEARGCFSALGSACA